MPDIKERFVFVQFLFYLMFYRFVFLEVLLRLVFRKCKELFHLRLLCFQSGYRFFGLGYLALFLASFGRCGFLCGVVLCP